MVWQTALLALADKSSNILLSHTLTCSLVVWQTALLPLADKVPIFFCHTLTYSLVVWQTALLELADKRSNNLLSHTLTYSLVAWQTALLALADKSSNNLLSHTHLQPRGLADSTPRTCRQKVPIIFCHTLTYSLVVWQTAPLALADKKFQ